MVAQMSETKMNPLNWKREHQIALLCASGLGALFGFIFAIQHVSPGEHPLMIFGVPGAPDSIYLPWNIGCFWRFGRPWED
jgi:hypothetical protein